MHAQPPLPTQAPTQAPIAVPHLAMLPPPQLQQPPASATVEFLGGLGKGVESLLAGAFLCQPASSPPCTRCELHSGSAATPTPRPEG